jgi:hypothetical protein
MQIGIRTYFPFFDSVAQITPLFYSNLLIRAINKQRVYFVTFSVPNHFHFVFVIEEMKHEYLSTSGWDRASALVIYDNDATRSD